MMMMCPTQKRFQQRAFCSTLHLHVEKCFSTQLFVVFDNFVFKIFVLKKRLCVEKHFMLEYATLCVCP